MVKVFLIEILATSFTVNDIILSDHERTRSNRIMAIKSYVLADV